MGLFSRLRGGFREAGKSFGEGQFSAGGRQVICTVCEGSKFDRGKGQLNTAMATFLNFDWANRTASTLVCVNCGHILWFVKPPERLIE